MCRRLASREDKYALTILAFEAIAMRYRCQSCGDTMLPTQRYCAECGKENLLFEENIQLGIYGTMEPYNQAACIEGHVAEAKERADSQRSASAAAILVEEARQT